MDSPEALVATEMRNLVEALREEVPTQIFDARGRGPFLSARTPDFEAHLSRLKRLRGLYPQVFAQLPAADRKFVLEW